MTYIKTKFRPESRFFCGITTLFKQTQLMSLQSIHKAITYSLIDGVGLVERKNATIQLRCRYQYHRLYINIATVCE